MDQVSKTMLELAKQNHVALQRTLSAVNDDTLTLIQEEFPAQVLEKLEIPDMEDTTFRDLDGRLLKYARYGTEAAVLLNQAGTVIPDSMSNAYKSKGLLYASDYSKEDWLLDAAEAKGSGLLRIINRFGYNPAQTKTVAYIRSIRKPSNWEVLTGTLVVSHVDGALYRDIATVQLPEGGEIYLLNDRNDILVQRANSNVAMTDSSLLLKLENQGAVYDGSGDSRALYVMSQDKQFGTKLVYKIPISAITGQQTGLLKVIGSSAFLYLLIILLFMLYILRSMLTPLAKLATAIKLYEPNTNRKWITMKLRRDEIGQLHASFYKMTDRMDQLIENTYKLEIKQKDTELTMLHSQITPHLLYNTLDSIYWCCAEKDAPEIAEMVRDLSRLLRIGLSKGRTIITLAEELEHAMAYSKLQLRRYENSFQVNWDVDPKALSGYVPKLIVQPLIENAILHGVSKMDQEGEIWIRFMVEEGQIRIQVEDNGFQEVNIAKLNQVLAGGEGADKSYGIRNVHQRIQLHFGANYGLQYAHNPSGGTIAIIVIPFTEDPTP